MKKTIIAIMAFYGIATAGTTERISSFGDNSEGITTGGANSTISVTSLITLDDLTKIVTPGDTYNDTALLGIKIGTNSDWSISVGTFTEDSQPTSQLRLYNKAAGQSINGAGRTFTWTNESDNTTISTPYLNSIDLEGAVKGSITLGYNSSGVTATSEANRGVAVVFSVLYQNGDILTYYGIDTTLTWSSGHVASITYDSDVLSTPSISVWPAESPWTKDSLVAANKNALVPEPTTATLSLLALAGLAARRRRR